MVGDVRYALGLAQGAKEDQVAVDEKFALGNLLQRMLTRSWMEVRHRLSISKADQDRPGRQAER